jgi:diacylglycerol O-acyltransferase / wax synthase
MTIISQLSAQDAQFLYVQAGDVLTHVMSINVYDPATAPGGAVRFKDIVRHVASRCHTSPVFKRKLHRVPLDLDHPYWAEDPDFDVEAHMTHVRLPKPGDWRQFCILAARHFAKPMDMNRPLWDIFVVEGIDGMPGVAPGSYALLQRFHHAAIDGASGSYALIALCDSDSLGTPALQPRTAAVELGAIPAPATMLTRAVTSNLASPVKMLNAMMRLSPALMSAAKRRLAEPTTPANGAVPVTRFNERVSRHRMFGAVEFSLARLGEIRGLVDGATINDVILAICSGALRRYLLQHGDLPAQSLVAVAPINARKRDGAADLTGNNISAMTVELATHLDDPVQRLRAIRNFTRDAKEGKAGLGARVLADLSRHIPGATLASVARLVSDERIARNQANLIITNVPGAQFPLYMNGARLTHQFGMGPVSHGLGLFIAATSYDGAISFCVTADRLLVPDVDFFCRCVDESCTELEQQRAPAPVTVPVPKRKRKSPARAVRKARP